MVADRGSWIKATLAIAVALPLAGCNSFLGTHLFARHADKPLREQAREHMRAAAAAAQAGASTEEGRKALGAGQPGAAIEKFRAALAAGEPMAPALNGMGVAYARIGRFDLAQRFFEQAAAADPADPRYAANLTELIRSPLFAARNDGDLAARLLRQAAESAARTALADAQPRAGQLQRISRGEVHITGPAAYPAPLASRLRTARVAAVGAEPRNFTPMVRVTLPAPRPLAGKASERVDTARFLPVVRVALPAARPAVKAASASVAAGSRAGSAER
ncbi:MAG TPA: tetratricopeptide repeat protein [Novosphingobium sp.]